MPLDFKTYNNPDIMDHMVELISTPAQIPKRLFIRAVIFAPLLVLEMALAFYLLWPHYVVLALLVVLGIMLYVLKVFSHALRRTVLQFKESTQNCLDYVSQIAMAIKNDLQKIFLKNDGIHEQAKGVDFQELIKVKDLIQGVATEIVKPNILMVVDKKIPLFKDPVKKIVGMSFDKTLELSSSKLETLDQKLSDQFSEKIQNVQDKVGVKLAEMDDQVKKFNQWSDALVSGLTTLTDFSHQTISASARTVLVPTYLVLGISFLTSWLLIFSLNHWLS